MPDLLLQGARIVTGSAAAAPDAPVDVRLRAGRVVDIAPRLAPGAADRVLRAEGRWLIPGLWDHHVHMGIWSEFADRLNLIGTRSPGEVIDRVAAALAERRDGESAGHALIGMGYRASEWCEPASVAALDRVSGAVPVALIGGDGHSGWLNSAALARLGVAPAAGLLDENDWFPVLSRLPQLPGAAPDTDVAYRRAIAQAQALGVVGVTDLEFEANHRTWPERAARGVAGLRVRAGFYEADLPEVLATGRRTGDRLTDLVTQGPLKIISDGSLGTLTAHCCEPYAHGSAFARGKQNVTPERLAELLATAHAAGLEVAVHAIGDRAVADALTAFERTGARGSIEHAQLMRRPDIARLAALGIRASVQPAHLVDDREVTERVWADRADRTFMFRSMLDAGVPLALGSDAPVAPLNPWLAIDAAVWRAAETDEPWHASEQLTAAEALFASTDGRGPVAVGAPADLVLLDDDPLQTRPARVRVAATLLAGDPVFTTLAEG